MDIYETFNNLRYHHEDEVVEFKKVRVVFRIFLFQRTLLGQQTKRWNTQSIKDWISKSVRLYCWKHSKITNPFREKK